MNGETDYKRKLLENNKKGYGKAYQKPTMSLQQLYAKMVYCISHVSLLRSGFLMPHWKFKK